MPIHVHLSCISLLNFFYLTQFNFRPKICPAQFISCEVGWITCEILFLGLIHPTSPYQINYESRGRQFISGSGFQLQTKHPVIILSRDHFSSLHRCFTSTHGFTSPKILRNLMCRPHWRATSSDEDCVFRVDNICASHLEERLDKWDELKEIRPGRKRK